MAARTGARTGLSPPALASDSSALDHSATEGTVSPVNFDSTLLIVFLMESVLMVQYNSIPSTGTEF